jgi:selenocysteine lyase/cysteine desulfurase
MPIDLAAVRADTPATAHLAHFNNAGASLPPTPVLEATIGHLRLEAEIGGYEAHDQARDRIERTYAAIAELIGAQRSEIALIENATRAWDLAFYSFRFEPGDRILCARAEYASNLIALLQVARRTGAEVVYVPNDEHGQLSTEALAGLLDDDRVKLVSVTHVPTHGGLVNPAAEIGRLTRAAGVPYLLDACQSIGQLQVDVDEIGCDLLSVTGRKFLRGPRGTGFLYAREELAERLEPPMLDLDSATLTGPDSFTIQPGAHRFETWESNVAGRVGLGVAVDYALALGLDAIEARVVELADRLRARLGEVDGVTVRDRGLRKSGIVTFTVGGMASSDVADRLRQDRINVSSTGDQVLFDFPEAGITDAVRASVHYFNDDGDLDRLVDGIATIAGSVRA